ncbi:MAG: DUF2066 domain-containing protein [Hyphomicrobiaceae bacterium]
MISVLKTCKGLARSIWAVAGIFSGIVVLQPISARAAAPEDRVYTVAKYPVEAEARNAVAAKRQALSDGRRAAFRSLIKRLVPVTSYGRLKALDGIEARRVLAGVSVRSERNSRTRYVATLDFAFSPKAVRDELRRASIPFVDKVAPETTLVTVFNGVKSGVAGVTREMTAAEGGRLWQSVWSELDLKNTLTPLQLKKRTKFLTDETVQKIASGDQVAMRILGSEFSADRVLLAIAEPDPQARRLNVFIAGSDAVGTFALKRRYRIEPEDFVYSLELAAVISLGILEGRWKATQSPLLSTAAGSSALPEENIQLWVEFSDLGQWRSRQQLLSELPGVTGFETGGLSARGATVLLRYPGGGQQLQAALASQGLSLQFNNGTWILR